MSPRGVKQWFRRYDWDAVAGIVAAAVALVAATQLEYRMSVMKPMSIWNC